MSCLQNYFWIVDVHTQTRQTDIPAFAIMAGMINNSVGVVTATGSGAIYAYVKEIITIIALHDGFMRREAAFD